MGSRSPMAAAILRGKGRPLYSIGTLCRELCNNASTDLNDLYIYDVFPRKDVTFWSVTDNAAHLQVQIPSEWVSSFLTAHQHKFKSRKPSILGAWIGILKPNLPVAGGWLTICIRCASYDSWWNREPLIQSVSSILCSKKHWRSLAVM